MSPRSLRSLAWLPIALAVAAQAGAAELELRQGDRICLVGNELGERMQHHNFWETRLHERFPDLELTVRNLCFPGDEPFERLRSLHFGDPDVHLAHSKASVILFFFGFNESFRPGGPEAFAEELRRLVRETKSRDYSGRGAPRIVLVSPISFEDTGDPNLPAPGPINGRLARVTEAMRRVAGETGVGFVDLFTPTKERFEATEDRLTLDGAHLNEAGYEALAPILDRALFGAAGAPDRVDPALRAAVADKNFHWWHRYRAVNGYSIYGTRGEAGFDGTYRNRDVMERERAILDQMTANRDRRIWALARGERVPEAIDDSNTLPFLHPKTNVGGPDDKNRKAGKLGSLDYLPAAEQQKLFTLAPGYAIALVASEEDFPELAKPVALNFDARGRLWVSTMPSYPQWQPKAPLDDKLLILEDDDGDGRADRCKVFAGGLHQPTGFELGMGGAFVAQQPDILFLKDTDGDDVADVRYRRLVGFDSADSHHGLAAFEWGPDGALYFQEGTFKQSQHETPYGPLRLGDAGVYRYEPRAERLEVHVSLAFANPWGHVFDRWGQDFLADASPGFNYWATPISGHVAYPDKHPGGARAEHLDWGGSKGRGTYPTFIVKRIRPSSGCEIVSSRNFRPEDQGNFLVNNVIGDRAVLQHSVREEESGFVGEEATPLVTCADGNFRPVDLQFGPDGALYIVDWHNALIGHLQHNLRDPSRDHRHGRIWKAWYEGRPLVSPPKIEGRPVAALLDLLREPEDRTRYRVRRELHARPTAEVVPALAAWVAALEPTTPDYEHLRLEALWAYQAHHVVNEPLLRAVLESPDFHARAAATRVLAAWRDRVAGPLALLRARVADAYPRVRLEAVRACSFFEGPAAAEAAEVALDALNNPTDVYLDYTLSEALRTLDNASASAAMTGAPDLHAGHAHAAADGPRPRVFLDKPPKIVRYQLDRLSDEQLLRVDRSADDPRSRPVFEAVLTRAGLSRQHREEALAGLTRLDGAEPVGVLLDAIGRIDGMDRGHRLVARQLSEMLLDRRAEELARHADALRGAARSGSEAARAVAFAGLIAGGRADEARLLAAGVPEARLGFLAAVPLLRSAEARASLREDVLSALEPGRPIEVRRAAVEALASVPAGQAETFRTLAALVGEPDLRADAVRTLLRIPREHRPADAARRLAEALADRAEATPPAGRTTDEFLDLMQLADELIALLPVDQSRRLRERLRDVAVRVVRIGTVQEEMRYDSKSFAVEAGRPVQVVLRNSDLMPHNLVITAPGALRAVAERAAAMTPEVGRDGKQYVPAMPEVLFATPMVPAGRQFALTFDAPASPGEYPFVCTFPGHWTRMYGVMVVVEDLDAWLADPEEPRDPLAGDRAFVRAWTLDDLRGDLASALSGRSAEIGRRIFEEATCVQCHKLGGAGGSLGPDLSDVLARWKGDREGILREILDPSHKVDPPYAVHVVATADGQVVSGIVVAQDETTLSIANDPASGTPRVVRRRDVDEIVKSPTSLMPRGLLDRFTRDEIFELLHYLGTGGGQPAPGGGGG